MKNLFLFATAAAVLCSCSNQPKYIIDGDIAGLEGTVYLYQGDSLIDSAAVKEMCIRDRSDTFSRRYSPSKASKSASENEM